MLSRSYFGVADLPVRYAIAVENVPAGTNFRTSLLSSGNGRP